MTDFQNLTNLRPSAQVAELRKKLDIEPGPLQLIRPKFETPMPPLTPALFPPAMPDPEPPRLELFDLDAEFAPAEVCRAGPINLYKMSFA